jgi:N-acetylglucosamine-6-phosphate deacetylase
MKLIWQMTRDGRLNLVTDAMAALGMPPGNYKLGSYEVQVDNNRSLLDDGTLAGSLLSMDQALRNLLKYTGCSPAEAIRTITATPASLLGLSGSKGQIAPGYDADLVLLSSEFKVMATFIDGQMVYRRAGV